MAYDLLEGIKVIDLSTFIAAPVTAQMMSELGAEVIKVESLKGDTARYIASTVGVKGGLNDSMPYEMYNSSKKKLTLNLKSEEGLKIFHELLKDADVLITNNRTKSLKKMGLDYDSLKDKYPSLVYGQILGYGDKGPLKDAPGFDSVAFWTRSGFLGDVVTKGDYPINAPYGFGDVATGTALFGGVCAALVKQKITGKGNRVAVSLYGASVWYSSILIASAQEAPGYGKSYPMTRLEASPLFTTYKSKDDEWFTITILDYDKYWSSLCKLLNREDLINDPRFCEYDLIDKNKDQLIPILEAEFAKYTTKEIDDALTKADIVHAVVPHFKDVNTDSQALENGYIEDYTYPTGQTVKLARQPIAVDGQEPREFKGTEMGADKEDIMRDLGYSEEQITELKDNKII